MLNCMAHRRTNEHSTAIVHQLIPMHKVSSLIMNNTTKAELVHAQFVASNTATHRYADRDTIWDNMPY